MFVFTLVQCRAHADTVQTVFPHSGQLNTHLLKLHSEGTWLELMLIPPLFPRLNGVSPVLGDLEGELMVTYSNTVV